LPRICTDLRGFFFSFSLFFSSQNTALRCLFWGGPLLGGASVVGTALAFGGVGAIGILRFALDDKLHIVVEDKAGR
jgi:hypothetical protein